MTAFEHFAEEAPALVTNRLEAVRHAIRAAARGIGRSDDAVRLVAVSKTQESAFIRPALEAGQTVFGENRVQEAEAKWPELRAEFPNIELHLIGPLQTNKVPEAVKLFDVIESVDRPRLALALAREMDRSGFRPACLIQVNTGEEPQKAGILPEAADSFIRDCRETYALPVTGLMCIPPVDEEPSPHFALLRDIARRNGLDCLSMGMSDDFEIAIRLGATHVRIGTAIFGRREVPVEG